MKRPDPQQGVSVAVTITDVARAVGVSASTVSRALSRPERVDADTRAAILEQIRRLGYQPNRAARSLITGRTGNLGVIVPDLANPFFPDVVKAVQVRAHQRSLTTLLADSGDDPASERELVHQLAPQVDGLVLCGATLPAAELQAIRQLVPLVLINRDVAGVASVSADNAGGAGQAIRHLRALGHRRVGFVGGPEGSRSHQRRLLGARAGAEQHGLELVELGSFRPSFEGGMAAADSVLLAEVPAVLAYNDVIAIGLLHRLSAYGVAVPGDVSVVGFDDIALAAMAFPALTTVRFPRAAAGRLAVDRLLGLIADPDLRSDQEPLLPTELVVRQSTGRPARAATDQGAVP
jgi:DNA-binding LacI/PurR family transcriptional regulator